MEGFTAEDRKTLTTVEVEVRHVREGMLNFAGRITRLEADHVREQDLRDIQVDLDDLRGNKADRAELNHSAIEALRKEIESLQRWRWFERGAVISVITGIELASKFFFASH